MGSPLCLGAVLLLQPATLPPTMPGCGYCPHWLPLSHAAPACAMLPKLALLAFWAAVDLLSKRGPCCIQEYKHANAAQPQEKICGIWHG